MTSGETKIYLDPRNLSSENFVFISHAHSDHLVSKSSLKKLNLKKKIMCSQETIAIANIRGHVFDTFEDCHGNFKFIDTGHILGSRGLLIEDKILYTGDLSIRERAFISKPIIPKVETLIIESTFGKREYIFPPLNRVIHEVNSLISSMYDRGVPVILMGYSLGKAQILTSLFGSWKPLIVHDEILKFNQVYRKFGINLEEELPLTFAMEKGILNKKPWILIHPLVNSNHVIINMLKKKYGAITIGFSGWGVKKNYKYMMNLDHVFPFSDHCDFKELLEVVTKCKPNKIYTFHGFEVEFARELVNMGYDAEPAIHRNQYPIQKVKNSSKIELMDTYL
ncbi:exonuclease [Candidatus Nitrosocosmicus franklandus]|uniref:exonuclease n=1 Tax=Candidatus Nitrosocosmicus franklandianus TaxID=1798806 RepID=UPI00155888CC|nr:exonuclease [Candidatus Nitrosocosmicus franklandus]